MENRNSTYINENEILSIEAKEAVKEISFAVQDVQISQTLPSSKKRVYLNVVTKEKNTFCIELTVQGFRVVGREFDTIDEGCTSQYFETIYALLDNCSPEYRRSFGDALMNKLSSLQQEQQREDPGEDAPDNSN